MPASFDAAGAEERSAVADRPIPTPGATAVREPAVAATDAADVLIVEDDATIVEMLTYTLANRGYRCRVLHDGREALSQLTRGVRPAPPPVVVLNIDLPGLGRVGAVEQIERAHPEGFRVLACTRTGSEREHVRALNAGAMDYFVKPISLPVLTAKIIRLLWDHPRQ
jgi:DNA-binding response OmpR family regulator